MADGALARAVGAALGAEVRAMTPLSGGDINDAYAAALADGRRVFVKTHARAPASMFPAEARGLRWLAAAGALRVPQVLAVSADEGPNFLALELLTSAPRRGDFDEQLGRGLAALHRAGAPCFGLDHDNFIGSLPQTNAPLATWPELYRARRLEPLARRAVDAGHLRGSSRADLGRLLDRLEELVGPAEPPARLHGDLWGGNLLVDERGMPCLIDPAVYGGHREVDLAMMRLFGGFTERVFAAYDEAFPLAPGAAARVSLYQLYPLLVHVCLFGGSYVGALQRAVARYV